MSIAYFYSLLSVVVVSLVSLIGVSTLILNERTVRRSVFLFVSLAVGALLGDAFIHLIPEAFESGLNPLFVSLAIIGGILVFMIFEKILHWHHHLEEEDGHKHAEQPVGKLILISDGVHNFIDGIVIAASYLVSTEIGIATTIAVILHEIPQEIGDFGVLLKAGFSAKKALLFNFLSAVCAILGAASVFAFGTLSEALTPWLLPIAAGGFIYIALADLIPELQKEKQSLRHIIAQGVVFLLGIGAMITLLGLE